MADHFISGAIAALVAPYFAWNNYRILRTGEIFLSDDFGKFTAHYTRAANPVAYWLLVAFSFALLFVAIGVAIWGLRIVSFSN